MKETPEPAKPYQAQALDDKDILEQVDRILAQQKAKGVSPRWTQAEHIALLANVVATMVEMTPEEKADLRATLASHGLGGNASQFRQWLEPSTKAGSPNRLPAGTKAGLLDYE